MNKRVLYCLDCCEPFSHHWDKPNPATCPFGCGSRPVERILVDPSDDHIDALEVALRKIESGRWSGGKLRAVDMQSIAREALSS